MSSRKLADSVARGVTPVYERDLGDGVRGNDITLVERMLRPTTRHRATTSSLAPASREGTRRRSERGQPVPRWRGTDTHAGAGNYPSESSRLSLNECACGSLLSCRINSMRYSPGAPCACQPISRRVLPIQSDLPMRLGRGYEGGARRGQIVEAFGTADLRNPQAKDFSG